MKLYNTCSSVFSKECGWGKNMHTVRNNTVFYFKIHICFLTKLDEVFIFFDGEVDWHHRCIFSNTA